MAVIRCSPAPNAYNLESKSHVLAKSPAYGFGSSKQRAETNLEAQLVPGPGTY